MLDADLARLYGVATKNLNKAVLRNLIRFPGDFMFRLSPQEARNLRFQIGTSNWDIRLMRDDIHKLKHPAEITGPRVRGFQKEQPE